MTCAEAAATYLAEGMHPIPIEPRGKRPLVPWKQYQDTPPTQAEVEAWWTLWPEANVALVLGRGLFAVDVDGPEAAAALAAAGVDTAAAPVSRTSRGFHAFFRGEDIPDRVGVLPHVDIRGVGYVVAPPSVHPSGHVYAWEVGRPWQAPGAPPRLLELIRRPVPAPVAAGGVDWLTQALVGVAEGGRDQTCTRLAGYLLGKGLSAEVTEIILQAWAERCSPPFAADQVAKCVTSIARREGVSDEPPTPLAEALDVTLDQIAHPRAKGRGAVTTSISGLDRILAGGFWPGEYAILGARPSVGKTSLALQMGRTLAKAGTGVLVVSQEMTKTALTRWLLSQESGVRAENLKTGQLIPLEQKMLENGAERLRPIPLWLSTSIYTTDQLQETLATYTPGTLGLVIVDYLQLLEVAQEVRDSRARVERVSKDLRALALRHEIPLLVLSSLARPERSNKEWRPRLGDLRESGELEHGADLVFLMHREEGARTCSFHVAKNRDGGVGEVTLDFDAERLTFTDAGAGA